MIHLESHLHADLCAQGFGELCCILQLKITRVYQIFSDTIRVLEDVKVLKCILKQNQQIQGIYKNPRRDILTFFIDFRYSFLAVSREDDLDYAVSSHIITHCMCVLLSWL